MDDEHVDRSFGRFESEAELFLERGENGRANGIV